MAGPQDANASARCVLVLRIAFAALLCTCLFVHGPIGQAQEQGSPGAEQQAEHPDQDKLLAAEKEVTGEVRQLNSELAELKKVYSAAKGDEKTILEAQIRAKRKALTNSLGQLISYTKKLEDAGGRTVHSPETSVASW